MALITSSPNSAAGTRLAYDIVMMNASTEVTRLKSPSANIASTTSAMTCNVHSAAGDST